MAARAGEGRRGDPDAGGGMGEDEWGDACRGEGALIAARQEVVGVASAS